MTYTNHDVVYKKMSLFNKHLSTMFIGPAFVCVPEGVCNYDTGQQKRSVCGTPQP